MAMRSLAPGFRFHPTDAELVLYYLKKKVLGKRFHNEAIAEADIYNFPPWDLRAHARLSRDLKWYFFCPRERKYATGARTNRSTGYGYWKTTGKDKPVINNHKTVGMKRSLVFQRLGGEKKTERTDWMMHEYRLVEDEDLKSKGVAQDTFVICVIFEKDGPGPRNGAQYGAPFVEEEWEDDDDGEADVPSASGFTQEFILPDMHLHSERYCVGSTSNPCPAGPSQIAPSVVNVPPPASANDVVMEDPQDPCDEYLHSNGIFVDDIPATSSENDRVENLVPINPDGDHRAECTVDDIFNSLEPFMELNDFDDLLTSADGPGPSGQNNSEGFDRPIAAQSVWTSVFADDENFRGLWLKDLETPITCDGEAGQSNEVYVDASFSNLGGNDGLVGSGTISNPPVFAQPFHVSEVTHNAEDFPWLNWCPQSVWTSLFADGEDFWGMWLKDLETPIAHDSEAGQFNEVYVDASFSNLGGNDGLVGSGTISNPPVFAQSFHVSEATRNAEDFPWLNQCPQSGVFDGCVDMHQGYGVECTNQEIVRYDAVAANSSIDNPDVGCVHACENQGREHMGIF